MMDLYSGICAYSCFDIDPVTGAASVDHFVPKSLDWRLVYEWSNYRLASARMNSRKRDFTDVVDPFGPIADWFHIEPVGYQLFPNPALQPEQVHQVLATIKRLDSMKKP